MTERPELSYLLRHLIVSRSTLQQRFRKALDRSIYDVILATRLARVKDLLAESELSLKEIAIRTGFKHLEHLI